MSDPKPDALFAGASLRASLFRPNDAVDRLLVTFRPMTDAAGRFEAPRPVKRFLARGWSHLYLQSFRNDWYVNADTAPLSAQLSALAAGFAYRAAIGFSMGGYAALRLSEALRLDHVIAVSPQVSIAPSVAPFETRYSEEAKGFDAGLGDLGLHARRGLRGVVLFDPFRRIDRLHAEAIAGVLPDLEMCRMVFGGHPATSVLRETIGFGAVQELLLDGRATRSEVLKLHRAARAQAPSYWTECATACRRHRRAEAAEAALVCRAALEARP
ncbi:MAG: alpha/beta hydrolase [Paracoccaceae bacterium]